MGSLSAWSRTWVVSWLGAALLAGCGAPETERSAPLTSAQPLAGSVGISNGLVVLGAAAPMPGVDWDGDAKADLSVYRPATGEWLVHAAGAAPVSVGVLGTGGDYPVPADYTGDKKIDPAFFRVRNGTWAIAGQPSVILGIAGDIPVPGDYDGDGKAEPAVFRPSTGTWLLASFPSPSAPLVLGGPGDIPVPGDYDGDGATDIAVWHPVSGLWQRLELATGAVSDLGALGIPGDRPVPGDYDGDGAAELAVYRASTATWRVLHQPDFVFGQPGDLPVPADYDGDGHVDPATFRSSDQTFWISPATAGVPFGLPSDQPAQAPFQGLVTCDRPNGCNIKSAASWPILETLVRAHLSGGAAPPYVFRPWSLVGECEGGQPWDDSAIELGLWSRGFHSPDRGPYQISPIHFFHGTKEEWTAARAAWTKQEPYNNNDIALETDKDIYGFGFTWEQMLEPEAGSQFGVLLAARTQALGNENLGPWFKSLYCHAYKNSLIPIAPDIAFARGNDYARYELNGKKYVKTH